MSRNEMKFVFKNIDDQVGVGILHLSGVDVTAGAMNIYIDSTNGDNNNSGLRSDDALQSIPGFYQKFCYLISNSIQFIINLAAGTGGTQATYLTPFVHLGNTYPFTYTMTFRGPDMVTVTPATGSSTATVSARTAVSSNRTRIDFSGTPGWTNNNLAAKFARFTRAGAAVCPEMPITENDTDSIFIDEDVSAIINVSDVVTIVQPGAIIQGRVADLNTINVVGYSTFADWNSNPTAHSFERVQLTSTFANASASYDRCKFVTAFFAQQGIHNFVNCAATCQMIFQGARTDTSAISCRRNTTFISPTGGLTMLAIEGAELFVGLSGIPSGFIPTRNLSINRAATGGSTGAIHVGPNSTFNIPVGQEVAVQGSGNAYVGIHARGGTVRLPSPNTFTGFITITGVSGDLSVDSTVVNYGTGAGQFEQVVGFNGNVHRIGGSTAAIPLGRFGLITTQSLD